jgi:prepilin-type N-terminal cleavage/methylation domain-containing protein
MTKFDSRRGYTLFELIVVMAILILLAAVLLPTVAMFRGDSRPRAGTDAIRAELAAARARAKDEGKPYRIAISKDGKRLRRAPDDAQFADANAFEYAEGSQPAVDYPFEDTITAAVVAEQDADSNTADSSGWVTIAIVRPDGTCEAIQGRDNILVSLTEDNGPVLYLRIRGLTCRTSVSNNPNTTPGTNNTNSAPPGGKP